MSLTDTSLPYPNSPFSSLLPLLTRASPFSPPSFAVPCAGEPEDANPNLATLTDDTRILVVGAGGLGCELLKCLCLLGYRDIHLIDLDTIDVSNLNRQFLFQHAHCNKYKSQVAAEVIMARYPAVRVHAHTKAVQHFQPSWFRQFNCVIAGLDNVEARRWLNGTLVQLVEYTEDGEIDPDSVIPLIDGGTEAFGGQARVFLPRVSSCFECSLASLPAPTGFPACTIRNIPRIPEHAIAWALKVLWPLLVSFNSVGDYVLYRRLSDDDAHQPAAVALDKDNAEHMTWLFERARERAGEFGISGVTYALTQQVVKNIIPAIASTNAIIAAACANEAFKLTTSASLTLNNYFMYLGGQATGTNSETLVYARNPDCSVCQEAQELRRPGDSTLADLLAFMEAELGWTEPAVAANGETIYMRNLHSMYANNLSSFLRQLPSQLLVHRKGGEARRVRLVLT